MPYQFTAQTVTHVNPLKWIWEGQNLVKLLCTADVNYGAMGISHEIDILPDLTPAQVETAKQVYNFIRGKVEARILG